MSVSKNASPKITVYVVSHNYGRFLGEAIESVLRQTCSDWEMLIIDDNSSDHTADVMQIYSSDPRVRTFSTSGIGLPAVANLALREARGKYIIRLDGDDYFDENILLVLSHHLDQNPQSVLVFPDYYMVDEGGEVFAHERRQKFSESNHMMDVPPHGACTMIRKAALVQIGGYREDLGAQDGFDMWSKIKAVGQAGNINLPLFFYRKHGNNLTSNPTRILSARRQIKKDAILSQVSQHRPYIAVIPCREFYDFRSNLWSVTVNGRSLLQKKLAQCIQSSLFDKIVVTSDTDLVVPVLKEFDDPRIEFCQRDTNDTIRSRSIVHTMAKVAERFDPDFNGISVICYLPSPFVTMDSLEEAVYTLVMNDADSSIGVEEIRQPVFRRTPFGLQSVNAVSEIRSDFDTLYKEGNLALATRNRNFKTGSLVGKSTVNFLVSPQETFFIDSEQKLKIAQVIDSK